MAEKSNGQKPKSDPLPDHQDDFWPEDAQNYTFKTKKMSCDKHTFEMVKGNDVKCSICGVGYYLSPGMIFKDSHVYFGESIVI